MKPFESFLTKNLEEYLTFRQSLGFENKNLRSRLRAFDQYLKESGGEWDMFTPSFFLYFRANLKGGPCTVNGILSAVRIFFQFLLRQGIVQENPLVDIPAVKDRYFMPFIFSHQAVEELLEAAQRGIRKDEKHFLHDLAAYLAITLLARCGLRISEPLRLLRIHYRPREATLYIERTKFKKDRLIPVPKSVIAQIQNYLSVTDSLLGDDQNPYLLAGKKQKGITMTRVYSLFYQAVEDIGLTTSRQTIANMRFGSPTPHSLRHSFAINTLKRIKQEGKSPQHALPILSAYMGHQKYEYTAVYLKVLDAQQRQGLVNFARMHHDEGI